MKLFQAIREFFGTEPETSVANRGPSALSVDIINYAISLASSPEKLSRQQAKLVTLAKSSQNERALIVLYLEVEQYMAHDDPVRTIEVSQLRQRIWERFSLISASEGMPLLFAPAQIQEVKLGLLVLRAILLRAGRLLARGQVEKIVSSATAGTVLSDMAAVQGQIDLDQASNHLARFKPDDFAAALPVLAGIMTGLFSQLRSSEGPQIVTAFEQAYEGVKQQYDQIAEDMSRVAELLPDGVMEAEKLRYLSRDALEERVQEKTKQLEEEKASVERKVRDRTRELSEEQAKLASSIDSLSQGLIMVDKEDHMILKNSAAGKVLGYTHGRRWSLDDLALEIKDSANLFGNIKKVRTKGDPVTLNDVKFGSRVLRLSLTPVKSDHRIIGVVLLIEDITEAKILERSREEFFSIASHELRTPLTAIRGNAAMIQQYFKEALKDHDLRGMVSDIHDSSVRLIEIVNDFLDASRLEQGRMKFTMDQFNVSDIIEKVTYELAAVSREKKIYLHVDDKIKAKKLPLIYADPDRVKQVLYNLIGNAMKFVEKGGVSVATEVNDEKTHLIIRIIDTGPGMSEEAQRLLFHKFQQAGRSIITRDSARGTGLGLYISKLLVEHMGGHVQLERSEIGKGSTFSFTLPLAKAISGAGK